MCGVLDSRGVVIDFDELDALVETHALAKLDHTLLNDTIENPTAEHIALYIFDVLFAVEPRVSSVKVWETIDSFAQVEAPPQVKGLS
jgi:6-pyruvoyltetrahydropterin/6-carboxytetrahydropterin synthase